MTPVASANRHALSALPLGSNSWPRLICLGCLAASLVRSPLSLTGTIFGSALIPDDPYAFTGKLNLVGNARRKSRACPPIQSSRARRPSSSGPLRAASRVLLLPARCRILRRARHRREISPRPSVLGHRRWWRSVEPAHEWLSGYPTRCRRSVSAAAGPAIAANSASTTSSM